MTQKNPLEYFMTNVDSWGALQWFDRLVKAVRERDETSKTMVLSKDEDEVFDARFSFDIANNVASSSASRLVRDFEAEVRQAFLDAARYQHLRNAPRREPSDPLFLTRSLSAGVCDWSKNLDPAERYNLWSSKELRGEELDAEIDRHMEKKDG